MNKLIGPFFLVRVLRRCTAWEMKLSIKDFFIECDQIRRKLRIRSLLLKKYFRENCILREVMISIIYRLKIRKPLILWWDWIILLSKIKFWNIWKNFQNFQKFWNTSKNFENTTYLYEVFKFASNSLVTEILNTKLNLFFIAFMIFLFTKRTLVLQ